MLSREQKIKLIKSILQDGRPVQEVLPGKACYFLERTPGRYIVDNLDKGHGITEIPASEKESYIAAFRDRQPGYLVEVMMVEHDEYQRIYNELQEAY